MTVHICEAIITLSVFAVFAAITADFINYDKKTDVKKSRRSFVATGSMFGFYAVYYIVLRLGLGSLNLLNTPAIIAGTAAIAAGAAMNISGRLSLKGNWANHIKIYGDHKLVNRGVYKFIRHPLYASIMLMLSGGSLAYRNWLSAALTAFVFIPFMYYRARQEEALLIAELPGYGEYMRITGMFFPKLRG